MIASTELNDFLAGAWPGVGQVFFLRRRFHHPLKCTQQIVYGFTSLTPEQAGPDRLLELVRAHWAIENKLHYRRDVTLREDACQVRKGQAPRTLAILNSVLLAVFDWLEVANVASQMRLFAARPFLALRLFMAPLERIKWFLRSFAASYCPGVTNWKRVSIGLKNCPSMLANWLCEACNSIT